MKPKRVPFTIGSKGWNAVLCGLFLAACVSEAKVPEPDTIFYGTVLHLTDQPLVPGAGDVIQVQALIDGVVMATASIPSGTNTYLFRIPMDDGVAPRIAGTAKGGDVVHIRVVNTAEGLDFEVNETVTSGIAIVAERGMVTAQNLLLDENLKFVDVDMDAMADAWELLYSVDPGTGVAPLDLNANDGALDNDGDGLDNQSEFIAGTDPLVEGSVFEIIDSGISGSTYSITFGPVRAGRSYAIRYKSSIMDPDWLTLLSVQAFTDSAQVSWGFDISGIDNGVFQATVEMEP